MSDCVFCKIVAGQIPSTKVFEDEHTLAFMVDDAIFSERQETRKNPWLPRQWRGLADGGQ